MYDFGFVALDILYTYPEDSGVYMCKATNKYGSDVNQVHLRCLGTHLSLSLSLPQSLLLQSWDPIYEISYDLS